MDAFKLYVNDSVACVTDSPALAVLFMDVLFNHYSTGVIRMVCVSREEVIGCLTG